MRENVLRICEKFNLFVDMGHTKVCTCGPTLTHCFPLKMAEIEENKKNQEKIQPSDHPNISKSKPYLFSPSK